MRIIESKYKDRRSSLGNMMYALLCRTGIFLEHHRWLYWLLNLTWGILMTLCGCIISLAMLCIGKKPQRWSSVWHFKIGKSWGGMSVGTMFLRDESSYESVNSHELGHSFQNAILGPFFIFIVAIPSAIRYWQQEIRRKKGKSNKPYDLMWFEENATNVGKHVYSYDMAKEEKQ